MYQDKKKCTILPTLTEGKEGEVKHNKCQGTRASILFGAQNMKPYLSNQPQMK